MEDLISVIIPVCNINKQYFEKCIKSIINQKYKNIEVLLILNGASNEIISFCSSFASVDKRIKLEITNKKGVSYARNLGISLAKGKLICFVDADDWLENNAFLNAMKKISEIASEFDYIMLKNYINYNENENIEVNGKYNADTLIDNNFKYYIFQSTYGTKSGDFHCRESVWGNFYSRDFLIKNNIKFDEDLKIGEDLLFNYEVWEKLENGLYINDFMYHYRKNIDSVMNNYKELINNYEKLFEKYDLIQLKLDNEFSINNECFYLRQIQRFAVNYFFRKDNNCNFFNKVSEFSNFINSEIYKNKIKKIKFNQLNLKKKIFTFLLKTKMYHILGIIFTIFNEQLR